MKIYVDIGFYWPDGLSVNAVYEQLLMQGVKIDRRTLLAAKSGTLTKSDFATLIKLRNWIRQLKNDDKLTIDDILKQKD